MARPVLISRTRSLTAFLALCLAGAVAEAQVVFTCGMTGLGIYKWSATGQLPRENNCQVPNGFRCHPVINEAWFVEKANPACNPAAGSCAVKIHATATIPGVRDMVNEEGLGSAITPWIEWYPCLGAAPCERDFFCGVPPQAQINFDHLDAWLERGVTCGQATTLDLSVKIIVCPTVGGCQLATVINIPGAELASALGCPPPPPPSVCGEPGGATSGAAGLSCPLCQPAGGSGGGCSMPVAGGGPSCEPADLGKAQVRYAAGGVGGDGYPGAAAWRTVLGRYWVHDFAERIVADPDAGHVWRLTRYGSFREFSNLAAGSGLRLYQARVPSDEFRKLYYDTATGGWELHTLDGRKDVFRSDGLWLRTVLAADPGHPTQATYDSGNQLATVTFPDGRSDGFTYHPNGKLATITENPVAGSGTPSRIWTFVWTGDELTLATRPDGTSWEFFYDPARPGYLARMDLVSGPLRRVTAAFEYEPGTNNVAKSWRGDPGFTGPNAVDKVSYSYTNPALPTQAVVTKTVSAAFDQVTTYAIGRDTASRKPKLTSMQGTCPTCGLSPSTSFVYAGTNPLLPSSMTDARSTRTDYTYDANGRLATKTEAANVAPLTRLTTYTYDANFPGLVTRVEVPSTSGGTNKRRTDSVYDATTGLMSSRTVDGFEGGAPLPAGFKTTGYTYNGSGEPATTDPPGFGATDVTTFTYNLPGRNGHVAGTRTDPLIGTTTYGYDGLNRRTSVIDPNSVKTVTAYDVMSRVTEVRRKGAVLADDLVTTSTYNAFGDLFCTRLPRGNGMEHVYDEAGRLKEMLRGTAVSTPTSTACLDAGQPRERTVWQLDGAGNRIEESLERWNGSAWVGEARTTHVYTCHLDKVTRGAGSPAPSVTEYCYDLNDNLEKVWDPNHPRATNANPTQLYAYDALNRLAMVTYGPGTTNEAITTYGYGVQDHLASVTDAEGNVTAYTFSDRDLMTRQVSPAAGTTVFTYNEHGELATETDARNVVMTRTTDALDRVTAVTYPNATLNATYIYDLGAFGKGRLSSITRNGATLSYAHDRFGRLLQDGALTYGWDKNGNRTSVTYPGAVTATYTHDFADREAALTVQVGANPPQPLVTAAGYEPFGPLATLTLGNGLTETRSFDARYAPAEIRLDGTGTLLRWSYTVDPVGNISSITDLLSAANNRTYGYQDPQYFLTLGNGPWGTRSWSYDRIGNRLTETRGAVTDTYTYSLNGAGGHIPKIATISRANGSILAYGYDPAGNVESDGTQPFAYGDDRRMSQAGTPGPGAGTGTTLAYDGRGYLRRSTFKLPLATHTDDTLPTYGSEGLLYHRFAHQSLDPYAKAKVSPSRDSDLYVFYFAGRPVATLDQVAEGTPPILTTTSTWQYLTTDHLGTPIFTTDPAGATIWQGGFEPFGGDYSSAPTPLRFPGQWFDATWNGNKDVGLYYNVHRWYGARVGRYGQVDPISRIPRSFSHGSLLARPEPLYNYAYNSPMLFVDPLGLASSQRTGCITKWALAGAALGAGVGGTVGATGAGGACTFVAPGVGTVGCGVGGGSGGATAGGVVGGAIGTFFGTLFCPDDCDATREERRRTYDHCLRLYEICVSTPGRHKFEQSKRCGDCFDICRREGIWPFNLCRLNFYPHGL